MREENQKKFKGPDRRAGTARSEFLRCLCVELQAKNAAMLSATAIGQELQDLEEMREQLRLAAQAGREERELLQVLEEILRTEV